jgi:hypothetical protein
MRGRDKSLSMPSTQSEPVGDLEPSKDPLVIAPERIRKRWCTDIDDATRRVLRAVKPPAGIVVIDDAELLVLPRSNCTCVNTQAGTAIVRLMRRYDKRDKNVATLLSAYIYEPEATPVGIRWRPKCRQQLFAPGRQGWVDVKPLHKEVGIDLENGYTTARSVLQLLHLRPAKRGDRGARPRAEPIIRITAEARRLTRIDGVGTEGGPVMLLEKEVFKRYRGANEGSPHYETACEIAGSAGVVELEGAGEGVSLAGPLGARPVPRAYGALIVRGHIGSNDAQFFALALSAPEKSWKKTREVLTVKRGQMVLLDAVDAGRKAKTVPFKLKPGRYTVDTIDELRGLVANKRDAEAENVQVNLVRLRRL